MNRKTKLSKPPPTPSYVIARSLEFTGLHIRSSEGSRFRFNAGVALAAFVYGLLLICKHFVRLRQGTTAYVYPVSLMMPFS